MGVSGSDLLPRTKLVLDKETQKARLDCLIYFFVVEFGWGKNHNSPVSGMRRLGYPSRGKLWRACVRVRGECPQETKAYQRAMREYREARRRFEAARTKKGWSWYINGRGNPMAVALRSHIEKHRRNSSEKFDSLYFKYRYKELLPREKERRRARREMKEASERLKQLRGEIFERMGVPPAFRRLA